ncbi:uncharacterized protein J4E87_002208 [Alternaria ethzedia]|uniref:uncharacterized protein n=1 Tax=Alternaria ethzedia TaxID=181014 RepID=UPI0020C597B8|nr:uncharacterized protein J4E87_002208 [Alternaria ethzedia]KAI4631503.1 hypothetical protein J4E87_002208 [Alternaria ethzedia]
MAPRKTAVGDKAPKAPATKKSADKVVKRPARGYHKFRNGLLNVTPKGGEKELVKRNEKSPLLRMPAEIRNKIWKLVLGGKLYESDWTLGFCSPPTEPEDATALLRTCRQIYSETAIMPLALTTFSAETVREAARSLKKLKPSQRKQITTLQLTVYWHSMPTELELFCLGIRHSKHFRSLLALREVRIMVYSVPDLDGTREKVEAMYEHLKPSIQDMPFAVKVDYTHQRWRDYLNS